MSDENSYWLGSDIFRPWICFLNEQWDSISETDLQTKRARIAAEWKNLDRAGKDDYVQKASRAEDFSIPTTIEDEPATFMPWTVYRTYYGEPGDFESQEKSDLAWSNVLYLLHYFPEYGDQFTDDKSMVPRSYSDETRLKNASAQDIINNLVIQMLDYSSMAFNLEGRPIAFGCTIILVDKATLVGGSGLVSYITIGGEDGQELQNIPCPLKYTQSWWNQIEGSGKSLEHCMVDDMYDPDEEDEVVKFKIDLTQNSEDTLADFLVAETDLSLDLAKEQAQNAIAMIDSL